MEKRFKEFASAHSLIENGDRVLACVSGGVDSMALLHLLYSMVGAENIVVAHCNFMLRGAECERETEMVKRHCAQMGIECRVIYFDTRKECAETNESIQMAARRLRYGWFDEVAEEVGCNKIAIAHHSNDTVETFFINLMRGTGLRGLCGIGCSRERIIRPLLFASREEIESYTIKNNIEYMTDSSNLKQDYLRSRLRYDILPRFEGSSGSFRDMMGGNIERLSAAQRFIDGQMSRIRGEVISDGRLDLLKLKSYDEWEFILFELLRTYGFSGEIIGDITRATHSGKRFYSDGYLAVLDRDTLIITERNAEKFEECTIESDDARIEWIDLMKLESLATPKNVALLSADELQFPLKVRKWQQGDYFQPLGMHAHKKVSDFLIDNKVSIVDKENQGVVLSGDKIIWLVSRRIDDRFKVKESTKKAIKLTL